MRFLGGALHVAGTMALLLAALVLRLGLIGYVPLFAALPGPLNQWHFATASLVFGGLALRWASRRVLSA